LATSSRTIRFHAFASRAAAAVLHDFLVHGLDLTTAWHNDGEAPADLEVEFPGFCGTPAIGCSAAPCLAPSHRHRQQPSSTPLVDYMDGLRASIKTEIDERPKS